jgi:hypothetical protein
MQPLWNYEALPVQPERSFRALNGVRHSISPENGTPFDYFNLYLPIFLWSRFANYTNAKAAMEDAKKGGKCWYWKDVCGAELKAWVASVMWWCLAKSLTPVHFMRGEIDPQCAMQWMGDTRFQNIKCLYNNME